MEDPDVIIIQEVEKDDDDSCTLISFKTPIVHVVEEEEEEDLYTPISCGGHPKNPILVEEYADDIQLQKVIIASLISSSSTTLQIINLSDEEEEEEKPFKPFHRNRRKKESFTETGQSSNSHQEPIFCPICMEPKSPNESFTINGCSHVFCSDCMSKYVASKIQDNTARIQCPDLRCNWVLEPEFCRSILPQEVFERWGNVLCESLIIGSMKFYCPYKDCSALLLDERGGRVVINESECPHCRRLFCAQCMVSWHSGIGCAEFQKLGKDEREREDIMLMDLAKKNHWQRCPKCRFYVERSDGCLFMKCRCGFSFCYHCGAQLKDHYCRNCKR
ncbi:E3 ubiquitin-protein ligase RSL1-like [Tasmannia lanceolata]|uniref:E3 ubiquitin-protein ligase RSL1-like n=1 Tax=Tasmannia lanceolata TaxID=3420 RepID=UPI004062BDEC